MGYVDGRWERGSHRGPPRRVYNLTPQGRDILRLYEVEAAT